MYAPLVREPRGLAHDSRPSDNRVRKNTNESRHCISVGDDALSVAPAMRLFWRSSDQSIPDGLLNSVSERKELRKAQF